MIEDAWDYSAVIPSVTMTTHMYNIPHPAVKAISDID
jgi:hypothetical protein